LDSVEGWNSSSIHFFAAASSARAGAVRAPALAARAMALTIVEKRILFVMRLMASSLEQKTAMSVRLSGSS